MSFQIDAPAKLNLFLNVVGRRADGYHEIESLFAFVGLADELKADSSDRPWVSAWGAFAGHVGPEGDNLVTKARDLMFAEAGVSPPLAITVKKRIPVAAGLGGGSADAAAAIRALNRFLKLDWPLERLLPLAAKLGADVPACLLGEAIVARGIGDRMTPAPAMPRCGVLLVNPNAPTPTPAVFNAYREANPVVRSRQFPKMPAEFGDLSTLVAAIGPRGNDLLPAALQVTPVIREVLDLLEALPDAAYVGLSGSGATCFALFPTEEQAASAANEFRPRRATHASRIWWTWSGTWFDSRSHPATLS